MADSNYIQYFLGANSPAGFYSLYDQLLPAQTARSIYILKGGPGCGKSTLMRAVAQTLSRAGAECEYILCSGDPASLDAVVFPGLKAALVDGTAPHAMAPQGHRGSLSGTSAAQALKNSSSQGTGVFSFRPEKGRPSFRPLRARRSRPGR